MNRSDSMKTMALTVALMAMDLGSGTSSGQREKVQKKSHGRGKKDHRKPKKARSRRKKGHIG